jgi:hypothetical protein
MAQNESYKEIGVVIFVFFFFAYNMYDHNLSCPNWMFLKFYFKNYRGASTIRAKQICNFLP